MKVKIVMIAVLALWLPLAHAGLKTEAEIRRFADSIVEKAGQGKSTEAFALTKKHWPLPSEEIDNLAHQTESQLEMVRSRFGDVLGHEFIMEEKIGNSFLRYQYIVKFERHAVRWVLIFYKPKDEWMLNMVKWDDQIELLYDK